MRLRFPEAFEKPRGNAIVAASLSREFSLT